VIERIFIALPFIDLGSSLAIWLVNQQRWSSRAFPQFQ
jgi:hypothetical protein